MAILSKLTDTLAIKTIEAYQQHLSPIKGFKCAAGQLYGGTTCSGAVKNIVQKQGLISGLPAIYRQFSSCHQAAKTLATYPTQPMNAFCCCVLPLPL